METLVIGAKKIAEWNRPLNVKTRDIFEGLKGVMEGILNLEVGTAAKAGMDMLLGIVNEKNDELPHRAYVLIYSAMRQAIVQLVLDSADIFRRYSGHGTNPLAFDEFVKKLDAEFEDKVLEIDIRFFSNPDQFPIVGMVQSAFIQWMETQGIPPTDASHLAARFKFEFINKLNTLWRSKEDYFKSLESHLTEKFNSQAVRGRYYYNQNLIARWSERMFDETFGLDAIYEPLNACYPLPGNASDPKQPHMVVDAESQIWTWLQDSQAAFKTLILRGGPGSGKSSLMKRLAMRLATENTRPVYFIQLQWFEFEVGLEEALHNTLERDPYLPSGLNPFDKNAQGEERRPVFIFDGLDELSRAGEGGERSASDFISKLRSTFGEYNRRSGWDIRVIVTGRDFVVQKAAEPTHSHRGQVLILLPYQIVDHDWNSYVFQDPKKLLEQDKRNHWWQKYQHAKGLPLKGIPDDVDRSEYASLSCQPLLSYLLARAHMVGILSSASATNINVVYEGLISSLQDRPWAPTDGHKHIGAKEKETFFQLLEELAVTAWHNGDVRTTNLQAFEDHCRKQKIDHLLKAFDGNRQGDASKLVIAFFARGKGTDRHGRDLIEFTHKSFAEYLVARKVVRHAVGIVATYQEDRIRSKENAIQDWLDLCSRQEITPQIWEFLQQEVLLQWKNKRNEAPQMHLILTKIYSLLINDGFEVRLLEVNNTLDILRATRIAEFGLLLVISAFARATKQRTQIHWNNQFQAIQLFTNYYWDIGPLVFQTFSYMSFPNDMSFEFIHPRKPRRFILLTSIDFTGASLRRAFINISLHRVNFCNADLSFADLSEFAASFTDFSRANLEDANLEGFFFNSQIHVKNANMKNVKLKDARFETMDEEEQSISLTGDSLLKTLKMRGALNLPEKI
jgi:hypothetical protein